MSEKIAPRLLLLELRVDKIHALLLRSVEVLAGELKEIREFIGVIRDRINELEDAIQGGENHDRVNQDT